MTRVLITDDHAIVREGLKEILTRHLTDVECGEAKDAEQALAQVRAYHWDLLLLDITMPGRSGLHVIGELKQLRPELPVLVLSMLPEDQVGKRVLKAGAWGYLNKDVPPEELIQAVRRILAGRRYVSPDLADQFAHDLQGKASLSPHEALSSREFEILLMIGAGRAVGQIAEVLHLSGTTVSTYRARILEKMGMTTTAELIRYAIHNNLPE